MPPKSKKDKSGGSKKGKLKDTSSGPGGKKELKKEKSPVSQSGADSKGAKSVTDSPSKTSGKSKTPKEKKTKKKKSPGLFSCGKKTPESAEDISVKEPETPPKPKPEEKPKEEVKVEEPPPPEPEVAAVEEPFDPFIGLSEDAKNELKCKLCGDPFDKPKALPCLHTFCEKCLIDHVTKTIDGGKIPCPTCHNPTELPPTGVNTFRDNYFVRDMLAILPKGGKVDCRFCMTKGNTTKATHQCVHCGDHLCSACSKTHTDTTLTKDHKVVTLQELKNGEHIDDLRSNQKVFCTLHPEQVVCEYCEGCAIPVCPHCKVSSHTGHRISTMEMALLEATTALKPYVEPMNKARITVDSMFEAYTKSNEEQKQDPQSIEQSIKAHFAEVRRMADEKEKEMLEKLAEEKRRPRDDTAAKVRFTVGYGARLLELGKDAEKLQQAKDLCQRLKDLEPIAKQFDMEVYGFKHNSPPDINTDVTVRVDKYEILPDGKVIPLKPKVLPEAVRVCTFKMVQPNADEQSEPGCRGIDVLQGKYFITDWDNKTVKIFDKMGNLEREVVQDDTTPLTKIMNVEEKDIIIYGMNFKNKIHIQGVYRGYGPVAINDKQIIIADHKHLIVTDETGANRKFINYMTLKLNYFYPFSVACFPGGNIVASDWKSKCVHVITKEGDNVLHTYRPKMGDPLELKRPRGVGVDEWAQIVVLDAPGPKEVHRFHVIDGTGTFIGSCDIKNLDRLRDPMGIAVIGEGRLAVLEYAGDVKLFKYLDQ